MTGAGGKSAFSNDQRMGPKPTYRHLRKKSSEDTGDVVRRKLKLVPLNILPISRWTFEYRLKLSHSLG